MLGFNEKEHRPKIVDPSFQNKARRPSKTLLSELVSRSYPSYKLELKIRKNYTFFIESLEEKIKKESVGESYKVFRQKNKTIFIYKKQGLFLLKPTMEVKIKVKKSDPKSSFLTLKGKPLSYSYQNPGRYINKLLVKLLS